jgi:DNA-binding beta-propeller fold protein YncE
MVKFGADGKFIKSWGRPGNAPGEFHTPHAVTLDAKGNVYVTDRENNRIQVFDSDGRFLKLWPNLRSVDAIFIRDDVMWAGAGLDKKILKLDLSGRVLDSFEASTLGYPHGVCVDAKGFLYAAERGRATKFRIRVR